MERFELGLSTGIAYRHPIWDVLEPIRNAGFHNIELSTAPHHLDLDDAGAVAVLRKRIAELGLHVCSMHAPFGHDVNLTSPDSELRSRSLDRLTRAADVLRDLDGGGLYVIHPGGEDPRWIWEREARLGLSVDGLTLVWERCRERGLTLVLETPLPHLLGGEVEDFAWILERLPREGTGVCLDTSHTALAGSLFECIERFSDRLVHVQASDNHGHTDDHLPPGEGAIDWNRVLSALRRVGYGGVFMLEVAGDGDVAAHAERAAAAMRRLLSLSFPGPEVH